MITKSDDLTAPLERGPKLTELVATRIRRMIIIGDLRTGDFLPPEAELMSRFGVSRPTLREALRVLESEMLIRPRRGSRTGPQVCAPTVDQSARYTALLLQHREVHLGDIHQARSLIEPPLARRVAQRSDPDVLQTLKAALVGEEATLTNPAAFAKATTRFHLAIADATQIKSVAVTLRQYYWMIETHTGQVGCADRMARSSAEPGADISSVNLRTHGEHAHLVSLLCGGDADSAEDWWRAHLESAVAAAATDANGARHLNFFG
ncbi:FadR/GntR family transcriptional regulator [Frankia sp. CiP3]|uniref:FadR/GntR family transcriptional regulator n=1 Tax=Frankia sp. CiP3 TaxID=2880971 RepID=UPI001EF566F7|nr:GntR family transcriptional regulator [Frankia sp. CiP3]